MDATHKQRELARIEAELEAHGYRMEASLSAICGDEGHAVVEIASGDMVDPPEGPVMALAVAWSQLSLSDFDARRQEG